MSFKPKVRESEEQKNKTYEMCYADWDTIVFSAAKLTQFEQIKVTQIKTGKSKVFKNVTEFRGRINKKTGEFGGWLNDQNTARLEKGLSTFGLDDFKIEVFATINEPDDPTKTILEEAVEYFDRQVGYLKKHMDAKDYRLIVGVGENPRYEWANILPYKGERVEKPILFNEVKDLVLEKYKKKVILAVNKEGDDEVSKYGWLNYQNYLETGVWRDCISFIDKDLLQIPSPSINYDKFEEGFTITDLDTGMRFLAQQCLSGDKACDNIQGLPNVSEEFSKKYGLRKSSGIGKGTAIKIVDSCDTMKEVFERVCEAYQSYYGKEDKHTFGEWKGEKVEMNWLDILNENARLLWMYRDDTMQYDIRETLDYYKVEYEN